MLDSVFIESRLKSEWTHKCLSNDMIDWLIQYKQLFSDTIDPSSTKSLSNHSIQNVYFLYLKNRFPENICMHTNNKKYFVYYGIINNIKSWIDQRLLEPEWIKLFSTLYYIVLEDRIDKYRDAGVLESYIQNTVQNNIKVSKKSGSLYRIFTLCKKKKRNHTLNYLNIE